MVYRFSVMAVPPIRFVVFAFIASLLPACSIPQTHSGFPVDIVAGPPPQSVASEGRTWLVYELHLTNYAPLPIELTGVEVFGDGGTTLAIYRGQELEKAVISVEELSSADSPSAFAGTRTLGEGRAAIMFINLALEPGASA
jgi:murein DD-endopeptidase